MDAGGVQGDAGVLPVDADGVPVEFRRNFCGYSLDDRWMIDGYSMDVSIDVRYIYSISVDRFR